MWTSSSIVTYVVTDDGITPRIPVDQFQKLLTSPVITATHGRLEVMVCLSASARDPRPVSSSGDDSLDYCTEHYRAGDVGVCPDHDPLSVDVVRELVATICQSLLDHAVEVQAVPYEQNHPARRPQMA